MGEVVMTQKITDQELLDLVRGDSVWNRARQKFSGWSGKIDQVSQQRRALSPLDMRRMEFEAVSEIAAVLGVKLEA
jgi:hypothetical protein